MIPFKLEHLGLAYRKAKVDLFYSSHASLEAIARYEENLHENLSTLLKKINGGDDAWIKEDKFLGTWTVAPKSVKMDCWEEHKKDTGNGLIFSSPDEEWQHIIKTLAEKKKPKKPEAEFRVMAKCSLDFHVLSTLWILKVGYLFDAKLSDRSYGNRLRRTRDGKDINELSLGSFQPYMNPFRNWRDKGISAMRNALDAGKKIVALTADVSSFYHELNPDFMLNQDFITKVLKLELNKEQQELHRLFIRALQAWAKKTPLKKGLPVGLPASAIVANMALIELDQHIEKQVVPLYYGRYVDDILLVMENGAGFSSATELWEWLFYRSNKTLAWAKNKQHEVCFKPIYLDTGEGQNQIHFSNGKNKVFILAGESGKTLVAAISHQIYERASEWRAMPRLPLSASDIGTDLLAATQSDGEAADNLRKTDALTMRRAGFAIKLRDFEAYERDLPPETWVAHRHAFFHAVVQHVLVLPYFFDLAVFLPRIIRLATACEDFADLRQMIDTLRKLYKQVQGQCAVSIKALPNTGKSLGDAAILHRWKEQLFSSIRESITAAFPPRLSKAGKQAWESHMSDWRNFFDKYRDFKPQTPPIKYLQKQQSRLFSFDLAHMPFRFIFLPKEMVSQRGIPAQKTIITCGNADTLLCDDILKGSQILAQWTGFKHLPQGFVFATRPFSLPELFILNRHAYVEAAQDSMQDVVLSTRGFKPDKNTPLRDKNNVLRIPDSTAPRKHRVVVSSWHTCQGSWNASVMRMPDPDIGRYARLCRFLNGVIACPGGSRYLILPELALPAHWFIRIASKLQRRGISLITGIEYLHANKSRIHNQIWAALSHDGLGFPSFMIYRQDKQRAALHEEQALQSLAGLTMKPGQTWKTPPIIQHGDLRFSMLICSELTNIRYRADLRGKVDVLFVSEWNQDVETFNALIESAALDIHAYIIQCNDRQYGDSRIRAPYKDNWERDILRVKGGIDDYCVIGEIDVQTLRQFQSRHRSPGKPFKPVPDGFVMDPQRKVLPLTES